LGADVREKHGLVYDVRTVNVPMKYNGLYYMSLATDNTKVEKALQLVRKHLKDITTKEVSAQEFDDAKAYLIGSFPLRLDSNAKLLSMLTLMQSEKLGKDYMDVWPRRIAEVTREDILRVAKKLIHPDRMLLVVVGDGPALKVK
jgi:zinc protease